MTLLLNVYSTLRTVPAPNFPHNLLGSRDRTQPELEEHLQGFAGYIHQRGPAEMNAVKWALLHHIGRTQNHLSLEVEEAVMDYFSEWAWDANAICFLPDGTVRDPDGNTLMAPGRDAPDPDARIPYPEDARQRKTRTEQELAALGINTPATLPPVLGEGEVALRPAREVAVRAMALFLVAVRAESLASNSPIPVSEMRQRKPLSFEGLSPEERTFITDDNPEQNIVIPFVWRYEALFALQWALGMFDQMPFPTDICNVPLVARAMLETDEAELLENAALLAPATVLEALDLHYRLHWAARQARIEGKDAPAGIEEEVLMERHHALNWLTGFEPGEWDEVQTPT